jgi:hypothetical protein
MSECLPDFPRYIRCSPTEEWQLEGADHPDGPWLPIPAPQSAMPWGQGNTPPLAADLALRVQRLEAMRETEKAALLDAFRQINELKKELVSQYWKLYKLEESITLDADR